ncbi:MAG: hypothetical protein KA717_12675 [Woronichinia naegeliana WA131]|uniref:Uncharacterized protein n=1 Tax=Woronichinia naegeliana WA131 TaxID=2824559 RepID=A0A977PY61_9CYAN|nr:MAG: hypothetical protein KA717_12675 [Woronichinia naegeliana WA131]
MSGMAGKEVKNDLLENHGRKVALSYIQRLSEAVGSVVQAKEEAWSYAPPKEDSQIATVGIGLDGTCMLRVRPLVDKSCCNQGSTGNPY